MLSGGLVVCEQHSQRLVELLPGSKQDTGLTPEGAQAPHRAWGSRSPLPGAGRGGGGAGTRLTRSLSNSALLYLPLSLSLETGRTFCLALLICCAWHLSCSLGLSSATLVASLACLHLVAQYSSSPFISSLLSCLGASVRPWQCKTLCSSCLQRK